MEKSASHEISIANTSLYLRSDSEGNFDSVVAYSVIKGEIYGAFYGYAGGGDYDGGFFKLSIDSNDFSILDYDQVENDKNRTVFNDLMQLCGQSFDDDDSTQLTEDGIALIQLGDEDENGFTTSLLNNFDGDLLSEISENWNISLRFEC